MQAANAQISHTSRGTIAEMKWKQNRDRLDPDTMHSLIPFRFIGVEFVILTKSGQRGGCSSLLTEWQKLLGQHWVGTQRHGVGPESGALLSHHPPALSQLLESLNGLQGENQSIFL